MSGQYQKLINKQYNSPIGLYSDQNVREILQNQAQVLSNGAVGPSESGFCANAPTKSEKTKVNSKPAPPAKKWRIDFNNPMINKPTNLQNSAVLRMLEEEENRKRSGQPGSIKNNSKPLRDRIVWPPPFVEKRHTNFSDITKSGAIPGVKRVAWPPPPENTEEFVEQPPVQAQGGPVNPSIPAPGPQVYHIPIQQPVSAQPSNPKPAVPQPKVEEPKLFTTSAAFQPAPSASPQPPISPSISRSPVDFTSLAKPWSPQQSPTSIQYRSVNAPSVQSSYKSSKVTEYSTTQQYKYSSQTQSETQPVLQVYSTSSKESTFEERPTTLESKDSTFVGIGKEIPVFRPAPAPEFRQQTLREETRPSKFAERILTVKLERADPEEEEDVKQRQSSAPKTPPQQLPEQITQTFQQPTKPVQFEPQTFAPQSVAPNPPGQITSSVQLAPSQQGVQTTFIKPKPVEPPPSTITLRPQAPVSQAPPPLVSSQPATAKFKGGKNLRGDLKWPPEEVKEKMAAEKQHLLDLAKGPACRPKKQQKDYTSFFAKHQLNSTYPGYKIPPGTQFYEHNPMM